jgi:hypothetical protein
MSVNPQIITTGLWRWLQGTGMERFEFARAGDEWIFRGTILTVTADAPAETRYELVCDQAFSHPARSYFASDGCGRTHA